MNGRASILAISTFLLLILPTHFVGCGGGGGGGGDGDDGVVIPGDFLLFYGDNTNPDTGGDGLFKIQDGDLRLLKIINPVGKSHVQGFTAFGELTIFSACNVGADCEPWITDGTSEGTRLLKDINPYGDSNPLGYILFDDEIYFSADDGEYGVELWKTNGTENGTVIVKNIGIEEDLVSPTPISSDPHALTIFNGALYFVANDIDYEGYGQGIELWKTDSTETGTVIVKNIAVEDPDNPSGDPDTPIDSSPHALTVFNGALYFAATDGPYGPDQYGIELWKTDGTEVNTVIVKNIGVDAGLSYDSSPEQFTIFNNELYFFADDGSSGFEPWKTDGTEGGTVMVQNIGNEVAEPFPLTADNLTYWAEVGGNLFFTADSGTTGKLL
jgi:ELWxxDGT repeat protein